MQVSEVGTCLMSLRNSQEVNAAGDECAMEGTENSSLLAHCSGFRQEKVCAELGGRAGTG